MTKEIKEKKEKVVIYTYFAKFLDMIGASLESTGIKYVEIRGKMTSE